MRQRVTVYEQDRRAREKRRLAHEALPINDAIAKAHAACSEAAAGWNETTGRKVGGTLAVSQEKLRKGCEKHLAIRGKLGGGEPFTLAMVTANDRGELSINFKFASLPPLPITVEMLQETIRGLNPMQGRWATSRAAPLYDAAGECGNRVPRRPFHKGGFSFSTKHMQLVTA